MSNNENRASPDRRRPSLMASDNGVESMTPESRRVLADLEAQATARRRRTAVAWLCGLAIVAIGGVYWNTRPSASVTIAPHAEAPPLQRATIIAVEKVQSPAAAGASSAGASETAPHEASAPAAAGPAPAAPTTADAPAGSAAEEPARPVAERLHARPHPVSAALASKQTANEAPSAPKSTRETIKLARTSQPQLTQERARSAPERAKSTNLAKANAASKPRPKNAAVRVRSEPDPDIDLLAAILRRSSDGTHSEDSSVGANVNGGRQLIQLMP